MQGHIYTEFYRLADESETDGGGVRVHFHDASGETAGHDAYLRRVEDVRELFYTRTTLHGHEVRMQHRIFVPVEHDLQWPVAKWDCEEILGERKLKLRNIPAPQPRRFAEAALVATPKLGLI